MFHLMLQKIMHKKWMVASLLIGNILLVAIAVSHPMYQQAAARRMLSDEFTTYQADNNKYPMMVGLMANQRKESGTTTVFANRELADNFQSLSGVPILMDVAYDEVVASGVDTSVVQGSEDKEQMLSVSALSDLTDHVTMLSGRMFNPGMTEDGFFEAVISQSTMVAQNLLVGEEVYFKHLKDKEGNNINVRIVGVFTNSDASDIYWVDSPDIYDDNLFIDAEGLRTTLMYKGCKRIRANEHHYLLLDYKSMTPEMVQSVYDFSKKMKEDYSTFYSAVEDTDYIDLLSEYLIKQKQITVTLSILQIPVIVLLCAFLFMISRQMLEMEESEIALLKSRGARKDQIVRLYFFQSLFLSAIGFVLGLPLGAFFCKAIGSSSAFLTFVSRRALDVSLSGEVFLYGFLAVLLSTLLTLAPVFKKDNQSIVSVKRRRSRSQRPLWQKLFLDVFAIAIALYGLYSFKQQQDELMKKVLSGEALDPLLFLSSALFILGCGLFAVRIQKLLVKLIYAIGKKNWAPAGYTSFLQLIRNGNKQNFIILFLILTVSFGIFNTTIARTILANAEENMDYTNGADMVVQEFWKNNAAYAQSNPDVEVTFTEPDYGKYGEIAGAGSMTKVFKNTATEIGSGNDKVKSTLLAINTKEFGETTHMPEGLLKYDYHTYLNVLSKNSKAVLMSSNFRDKLGYKLGDEITYTVTSGYYSVNVRAVIYGFFDYWPSYRPTSINMRADGVAVLAENYMIVGHLAYIQETVGIYPYEIWMDMGGDTAGFYDFVEKENLKINYYQDGVTAKNNISRETLFQGTNGILTMSFIAILIICCIGYLIYWTLSIRSRELLFGIFRAMGMSKAEIVRMLINEQTLTSVVAIVFGVIIGKLASSLYIPILQIAYSDSNRVLPLKLITQSSDMVRLLTVIGITLVICLGVLIRQVFNMKITQALKLGED